VHATLIRNLKGKPPVSDLFGARGRRWLAAQDLPADEQETVAAGLRQIEFLDREIALIEKRSPSRCSPRRRCGGCSPCPG
jgi:transposase